MSNAVNVKQGEEIDLHQLYGALANNRWLFAAVTGIFVALSVGYALLAEPIYQSDVMIQVEPRSPMPTLATQALSQIMAQPPEDVTEIALLTSRMVVGKAVNDLKLDIKAVPQRFPLIGNFIARRFRPTGETPIAPPMFGMRRYAWGGEFIQVSKFDVPDMLLGSKFRLVALGASTYELTDADGVEVLRGRVGELAHGSGSIG
jgi:tyrosine-protein kinase Etk/Wzc